MDYIHQLTLISHNTDIDGTWPVFRDEEGQHWTYDPDPQPEGLLCRCVDNLNRWSS